MNVTKIFLTLSDFVTSSLWLLTLKYRLRSRLKRFTTTDSGTGLNTWRLLIILQADMFEDLQMTGLIALREQSDLPTLYGLVWWLYQLRYEHFDCVHYKNSQIYWHLMMLQILLLLITVEQKGLLTVNGLISLLTHYLHYRHFVYWHY